MSPVLAASELKEGVGSKYIGRFIKGVIDGGDFGPQLKISVEPLDHEIGGETGNYHEWYSTKLTKGSKIALLIQRFADMTGPDGEKGNYYVMDTNTGTLDVGSTVIGPVVGAIFEFERKKLSELGFRLNAGMNDNELLLPVAPLTQAEADARIAEQGGKRMKEGGANWNGSASTSNSTPASSTTATLTDDTIAQLDSVVLKAMGVGLTKANFVKMAAALPELKANPTFKRQVVSLKWLERQAEEGTVEVEGDTFKVTEMGKALAEAA